MHEKYLLKTIHNDFRTPHINPHINKETHATNISASAGKIVETEYTIRLKYVINRILTSSSSNRAASSVLADPAALLFDDESADAANDLAHPCLHQQTRTL